MKSQSKKIEAAIVSPESERALDLASRLGALGYEIFHHPPSVIIPVTAEKQPDLVLADVSLIDETGCFSAAGANHHLKGIPVVYFGNPSERKRLDQCPGPPYFYLAEPFIDQDIKHVVETAFHVAQMEERRRQAEDNLAEKVAFLKSVGKTANVAGWEIDARTLEIKHTGQLPSLPDLTWNEPPTCQTALEYIHPDDRKRVKTALNNALKAASPFDLEVRLDHSENNEKFWARIICYPHAVNGRVVKLIGTFHDITWRKQIEQTLQKEKTLLKAIIDSIPVMITRYDPDANMLYLNKYFETQVGWTTEEIREIDLLEQVYPDPDYRQKALAYMQQATTQWKAFRLRSRSGRIIDSEWSNIKLEDGTQIGIGIDISERKRAEAEKERLEEQLHHSQKMQAIGTLAGGIAHDFNNLLQAILGHTQIMLLDGDRPGPDYSNLKAIQEAGERAARLVRQLLLFSRKAGTAKKPIALNREIEQTLKVLEQSIPRAIKIEFRPSRQLWPVSADRVQIEQVLLNLGINAAESMPSGGRLLIETDNLYIQSDHPENHGELHPGPYVRLSVSDTGVGIKEDILPHIFEPFFTTKGVGQGSGLGLASVFGIVKNHGGHILCHSRYEEGTTFRIYLPAIEKDPTPGENRKSPDSIPVNPGHPPIILLVDDDDAVRDCTSAVLKRFGYTVLSADSGETALNIFRQNLKNINLVILDLSMPGMGGQCCLREIIGIKPSQKTIVASGSTTDEDIKQALAGGAVDFIGKPYNIEDFLNKVEKVLKQSKDVYSGRLE